MRTADVSQRLTGVRQRIEAAGGDPDGVTVVAITKGHGPDAVQAAVQAGITDLGESYAQELVGKAETAERPVRWHFVGRLQRNKVRLVAPFVGLWQSVDRMSLAAEVAHRAPGAAVLVQVSVTGAPQQGGCPIERTAAVVEGCRDLALDVRGLMAIGPRDPAESRPAFRRLRELADDLDLPERSMGMSGDLDAAVAEGATMVRVGTVLFGPRGSAEPVRN